MLLAEYYGKPDQELVKEGHDYDLLLEKLLRKEQLAREYLCVVWRMIPSTKPA